MLSMQHAVGRYAQSAQCDGRRAENLVSLVLSLDAHTSQTGTADDMRLLDIKLVIIP